MNYEQWKLLNLLTARAYRVRAQNQLYMALVLEGGGINQHIINWQLKRAISNERIARLIETGQVDMPEQLINTLRQWANFEINQLCATCKLPFYCASGTPVCYGCRLNAQRIKLLYILNTRAKRADELLT